MKSHLVPSGASWEYRRSPIYCPKKCRYTSNCKVEMLPCRIWKCRMIPPLCVVFNPWFHWFWISGFHRPRRIIFLKRVFDLFGATARFQPRRPTKITWDSTHTWNTTMPSKHMNSRMMKSTPKIGPKTGPEPPSKAKKHSKTSNLPNARRPKIDWKTELKNSPKSFPKFPHNFNQSIYI